MPNCRTCGGPIPPRVRRRALCALALLAAGYEVRWLSGAHPPKRSPDVPVAIIGKPGPPYVQGGALAVATLTFYLDRKWIAKAKPYVRRGWQLWRITPAGRAALKGNDGG